MAKQALLKQAFPLERPTVTMRLRAASPNTHLSHTYRVSRLLRAQQTHYPCSTGLGAGRAEKREAGLLYLHLPFPDLFPVGAILPPRWPAVILPSPGPQPPREESDDLTETETLKWR